MHEDWVESIHIQSVSAFRIVVQIHFPGGIMGSDEEQEVNVVLRKGLLRDSGYIPPCANVFAMRNEQYNRESG
jgi:hypothetical protein